jgi:hypothetical protein
MRSSTLCTLLAASFGSVACHGTEPAPLPSAARPVVELGLWQVWDGSTAIGFVRHLEIRDPKGPLPYYRIEDLHGRWLGHASEQGRFSRRVPFADEEEDLGILPMARGVQQLFEASTPLELKPVAVEADARRDR